MVAGATGALFAYASLIGWEGVGVLGGGGKVRLLSHGRPRLVQAPPPSPPASRAGTADLGRDSAPRRLSVDLT